MYLRQVGVVFSRGVLMYLRQVGVVSILSCMEKY